MVDEPEKYGRKGTNMKYIDPIIQNIIIKQNAIGLQDAVNSEVYIVLQNLLEITKVIPKELKQVLAHARSVDDRLWS